MSKHLRISLVFALGVLLAAPAMALITGSSHDFAAAGWNTNGEICQPCHTPHNGDLTVTDAPLWNHAVTTQTFTLYPAGGTLDSTPVQPAGVSKLCLSCHDGTVALDSFGGATGTTFITGDANFGTDLSNDHPIAITYNDALATTDGELHPPTTTTSGLGGNIDDDMLFGASNDQLECASCHDVHNAIANSNMLLIDNAASALCLTCHAK